MQSPELDYLPLGSTSNSEPEEEQPETPPRVSRRPEPESPPRMSRRVEPESPPRMSRRVEPESPPRVSRRPESETPPRVSRRAEPESPPRRPKIPQTPVKDVTFKKRVRTPERSLRPKKIRFPEFRKIPQTPPPSHQRYVHRIQSAVFAKHYKGYTLTDGKTSLCHDYVDEIKKTLHTDLDFMGVGRIVTTDVRTREWLRREFPNLPSHAMILAESTSCRSCRETFCHRWKAVECARIVFGIPSLDTIPHESN